MLKNKLSFVLTLLSILGVLALAWFKAINIEILLPSLLGIYVAGRTAHKVSAGIAASKDPNANTAEVLATFDQ